ncbi:23686_t:CDS:2 [Gigaspora margarita]|uniref:23686_t:CDS:1 n=1 Tax=Gigaspora margarita TaxID=4874 RepID=A0ABN7UHS3_GIGMA|nr:23686_t:CDS:2 [Gigaspora margarita]
MATLTFRFNNIVDLINKLKPVNILVYIDMKLNNVVIHYNPKDEQNKEFLNSVKEYMPTLIKPHIVKHHHPRFR